MPEFNIYFLQYFDNLTNNPHPKLLLYISNSVNILVYEQFVLAKKLLAAVSGKEIVLSILETTNSS